MAIPLLEGCDIAGKVVTAPTRLLTQRSLATYLISSGRRTILSPSRQTNPRPKAISRCCSRSAPLLTSSRSRLPTTAVSKPGASGAARRSMRTSTFHTSVRSFWSSGGCHREENRQANARNRPWPHKSHAPTSFFATGAGHQSRPLGHRKRPLHHRSGTSMRIVAESVPASARKTSPAFAASRLASSSPSKPPLNPSPS